mgnify:CR=1 FL=1|tara:strand:- start:5182 stop:5442 length:261 start_codon:yes stop_codon:yes gene_type:complete
MIKLKDLLKENIGGMVSLGSLNSPFIKKEEKLNEGPDADLFKDLNYIDKDIIRVIKKYEKKADVDKIAHSWMLGLHAKLKKAGIKL